MNLQFDQVWAVDFEFMAPPGERPDPVCLVAWELRSGTKVRLWHDDLRGRRLPPYSLGPNSLFVSYFASAELGCHLALGWPMPERVLDLYAEFRVLTNGRRTTCGKGLVGALAWHGLPAMDAAEKDSMRQMILSGGPWSADQQRDILDYCEADVEALSRLLLVMLPRVDVPRALLRGRYMRAVAHMEHVGVPIDTNTLALLGGRWDGLKDSLITVVDRDYGVFDGGRFKSERFAAWLTAQGIPWPRLPSGSLALDDGTFRDMAKAYPAVSSLRELRNSLSQLRLHDLAVGRDGRNRVVLSPFGAKSGRNTPSNSRFIFGPSVWLRGLIQPPPGRAVAYVDWSQQEFGIAAALSNDSNMMAAYKSGDPYLEFAKQAGAVPKDATKTAHGSVRDLYKTCALGVQFGMGAESLAQRTGRSVIEARDLLRDHRRTYRRFWEWSDGAADEYSLNGKLWTVFGWPLYAESGDDERTARNFPMQGNGAEMMRIAASLLTEQGIQVCAPVHDAFLIEADVGDIDDVVMFAQTLMLKASEAVLSGFRIRTDATVIRHPCRYSDPRGARMWETVITLLGELDTCGHTRAAARPASAPAPECLSISRSLSLS